MAKSMKVVFRSDVRGVAQAGDVKTVSPGYARNFLFPRSLAYPATEAALRQWETERQAALAKAARQREAAQAQVQRLEKLTLTIAARTGDEGKLFGSVGAKEIVEALEKEGVTFDKRHVELAEPIRQVGPATVVVRLGSGAQAQLKVNVVPET